MPVLRSQVHVAVLLAIGVQVFPTKLGRYIPSWSSFVEVGSHTVDILIQFWFRRFGCRALYGRHFAYTFGVNRQVALDMERYVYYVALVSGVSRA